MTIYDLPELPTREIVGGSHWLPIDNPRVQVEAHAALEAVKDTAKPKYGPFDYLRVDSAVASLPLRQKAVVLATYWKGLSQRDVARRLKVGRNTVRWHHDKALARLRQEICA